MRAASLLLAATMLAGCASGPALLPAGGGGSVRFRDPSLTVPAAAKLVTPGRTSRQEVLERLGPAEAVRFDTGYEVWVYRARDARDPRASPELVLLLDPGGVVRKVREKPAYVASR